MCDIKFAFAVAPTGEAGLSDAALYKEVLADCKLGDSLGYDAAWFLEHHFTDYFPTPSPLLFMSYIAAHCPTLGLGTCVLVTPWYQPIRLAEEIAMLTHLSQGELHLGLGRGTAKLEYDAYGVDMEEARDRFREGVEILQRAFSGAAFRYDGDDYRIEREVRIRPEPQTDRIHLYGAIGSPPSATIMADLGLPPLCVSQFPPHVLEKIMANWNERATENGLEASSARPIAVNIFMADTDDEARDIARRHLAPFFALQAEHYEAEADHWQNIKGYEQFSRFFANLEKLADPANLDPFMDLNMIGASDTVAERLRGFLDLGYNYIVLQCATEGIPRATRHDTLRRFAADVAPNFQRAA